MTTFTDEDIAFQRAILAAPDDTTLKLVYADWLQDRADPRAEFVRRQVKLGGMVDPTSGAQAAGVLGTLGEGLDPAWVAFMTTLAQPFAPITFRDGEPSHPFTEPVGRRGKLTVLRSQYATATAWDAGLLADIEFLACVDWEECAYGAADYPTFGFVCESPFGGRPLTAREVLATIKAADFRSAYVPNLDATELRYPGYHMGADNDEIHTDFAKQYMFSREPGDIEDVSTRGLKSYVAGGGFGTCCCTSVRSRVRWSFCSPWGSRRMESGSSARSRARCATACASRSRLSLERGPPARIAMHEVSQRGRARSDTCREAKRAGGPRSRDTTYRNSS